MRHQGLFDLIGLDAGDVPLKVDLTWVEQVWRENRESSE